VTASIDYLPIWKEGATPEERFLELAHMARKSPGRFAKMVVVYEETLPNGNTLVRDITDGCTTNEVLGLLELGKVRIINRTYNK
jgi:hypothetical protein